jgi:hypothetical protein
MDARLETGRDVAGQTIGARFIEETPHFRLVHAPERASDSTQLGTRRQRRWFDEPRPTRLQQFAQDLGYSRFAFIEPWSLSEVSPDDGASLICASRTSHAPAGSSTLLMIGHCSLARTRRTVPSAFAARCGSLSAL